jgi:hypothetical protein
MADCYFGSCATLRAIFFHQAGDEGEPGGGFDEDGDVCAAGGDNKMGENSGGIKFAHTS